ncbi:MAG TPA: (2Fe-2S)-binding protein [Bacillota bacterium]|jgi:bacterioferritin-associated ferredoxin
MADKGPDTIICRCEDITLDEVRGLIARGYKTPDEIKRLSRCGMGQCQGRTCRLLLLQEIAAATGGQIEDIPMSTFRPPTKPIKLGLLAKARKERERGEGE